MRIKTIKCLLFLFAVSIILISIVPAEATIFPSDGVIHWKELDWHVYNGRSDPGNNYWNDQGVWVDNQNRLHLTITNNGGKWYCTGLETVNKYTYGTFTWTVASPAYTFDKNIVLGLFTYQDDNNELDIEPSRWGLEDDTNLGYTVQPFKVKGNERTFKVTDTDGANTTYRIDWKPYRIKFSSMQHGKVVNEWYYIKASGIPRTPEHACMNLWLIKPPSDGKNMECIISDFSYTPYENVLDTLDIDTKNIQEISSIKNATFIDFWFYFYY